MNLDKLIEETRNIRLQREIYEQNERERPQTDEEAAEEMTRLHDSRDPEDAHGEADEILLRLLEKLGYTKTVEAFHKVEKWYS